MARYRCQIARSFDSALPRDRIVNTIHFDAPAGISDPDDICEDVANAFKTAWYMGGNVETDVRLYDVPGTGPPIGRKVINAGIIGTKGRPREVALCLSFYAGQNTPRRRGRIYLDPLGSETLGLRPEPAAMARALALGQALSGIGAADIDWGVFSPTTNTFNKVTNLWVDNEWDTVRSRGLRPTERETATTSG